MEECKARDATYAAPLKVRVRLRNKETEEIKEQEIFMGDFPLMTKRRHLRHQWRRAGHRLPDRPLPRRVLRPQRGQGRQCHLCRHGHPLPGRLAGVRDRPANDVFYVRIDKNRKLPITCLIRALGLQTDAEILELFGEDEPLLVTTLEKDTCKTREEAMLEIYRKLRPGEPPTVDSRRDPASTASSLTPGATTCPRWAGTSSTRSCPCGPGCPARSWPPPVADPRTGEIIAEAGETLTRDQAQDLEARGVSEALVDVDGQIVKLFSNRMVDMAPFVAFDPEACGITEKVRFAVLLPAAGPVRRG